MNIKKLLEKGFFPKELPPPFTSELFASKAQYINTQWINIQRIERAQLLRENAATAKQRFDGVFNVYNSSKYLTFSLAKGMYSRRKLGIINPKQYYDLAKIVVDNWTTLRGIYTITDFSSSIPVEKNAVRSVRTKSTSLNNFKFQLIEKSFNKRYELKLDIAQFYPSVYTHSIPWAIMGRETAKKYFALKNKHAVWSRLLTTDPNAALYDFCNKLDTLVRNCQERQSIGLPVGPDTSFILAEIISSRIDYEIKNKLSNLQYNCLRYYDDYYFYVNSYNDAEKILKATQKILNDYQLESNDSKVNIKELPFSFESYWVSRLSSFTFKSVNKYEIRSFFAILYSLIEEYPHDSSWIILYALGRFEYGNVKVSKDNWDLFLTLLIKTQMIDASNINQFLKIILSYRPYLTNKSKEKLTDVLQQIIQNHLALNHSFEVSWALWIMKSLKLKCIVSIIKDVFKSEDYISQLICLDMYKSHLVKGGGLGLSSIARSLKVDDLFNEKWLLTYESIIQNWLRPRGAVIANHKYFDLLSKQGVKFYDSNRQISPEFTVRGVAAPVVAPVVAAGIY